MKNQLGQESAVFELLIAIIVMGFVILIGTNALETLQQKTCEGTMSQNLEDIRSAIETVVKTKGKAQVRYELPSCFNQKESSLRIIERQSATFCSAICEGTMKECTVLQFTSPGYSESKCLHISSATNFPDGDPCNTNLLQGGNYKIVNWRSKEGIMPGNYILMRESSIFLKSPVICVYKRDYSGGS
jgi:type II secretory pathway pseudopilin PulG